MLKEGVGRRWRSGGYDNRLSYLRAVAESGPPLRPPNTLLQLHCRPLPLLAPPRQVDCTESHQTLAERDNSFFFCLFLCLQIQLLLFSPFLISSPFLSSLLLLILVIFLLLLTLSPFFNFSYFVFCYLFWFCDFVLFFLLDFFCWFLCLFFCGIFSGRDCDVKSNRAKCLKQFEKFKCGSIR